MSHKASFMILMLILAPVFGEEPPALGTERTTQAQISNGSLPLVEIRRAGLKVFATPFNHADGFGDGPFNPNETDNRSAEGGGRPTLQGNGTFLRVNGLDAQTCLECHYIASNATVPATFGVGGFGGISASPLPQPTLVNVGDWLNGIADGVAEIDGRLINPPFLFGAGGVELVAKEMTRELQRLRLQALASPGTAVQLASKGIEFGFIVADPLGNLDTRSVAGIDPDLVVKPFGRKGEFATLRAFAARAMMFHHGMQPVEIVGEGFDADGDGINNEIWVGELSALAIFLATMDRPIEEKPDFRQGLEIFGEIGCAGCHKPIMATESRFLDFSYPEVPEDPDANVYYSIDLKSKPAGFRTAPGGGILVPMFSDLKRHDMGPALAESFALATPQQNREFITPRLWGVADSAPYLHDGRALTLTEAIQWHGGDAQDARDAFIGLSPAARDSLLSFLRTLRTPRNSNADVTGGRPR
ncbi:MAG: di-heme oxidoredictase family protein [Candidatus Competibacteraceae bacterium]|nr:di-heme oxidoredictase family protein [Candidatus Competibacteraceae bacterium]